MEAAAAAAAAAGIKLSRSIVKLCRIDADKHGLVHRPDGCLRADDITRVLRKPDVTDEAIIGIIDSQEPEDRRLGYKLDGGFLWVYCYQGLLSKYMAPDGVVDPNLLYERVTCGGMDGPLFHNTFDKHAEAILAEGLKPINRSVHLWGAKSPKKGRKRAECMFVVDTQRLMTETDIVLYLAGNGVYLTDSTIPPEYLYFKMR